ncbi:MAG: sulfate ABC transporter permease subunit CysT, partial [Rheinheimera sp.]
MLFKKSSQKPVLPGFGLSMGFTTFYLSLLVFMPLSALVLKSFELDWASFTKVVASERAIASYQLTFGSSFIAALINLVFGLLVAWV